MTYIFKCEKCKRIYEVELEMSELDSFKKTKCPDCNSELIRDYQSEHKSGIPIFFVGKDFFSTGNKQG